MQIEMWKSASRGDVTCKANLVADNGKECSIRRKVRAERSENHCLYTLVIQISGVRYGLGVNVRF